MPWSQSASPAFSNFPARPNRPVQHAEMHACLVVVAARVLSLCLDHHISSSLLLPQTDLRIFQSLSSLPFVEPDTYPLVQMNCVLPRDDIGYGTALRALLLFGRHR